MRGIERIKGESETKSDTQGTDNERKREGRRNDRRARYNQ